MGRYAENDERSAMPSSEMRRTRIPAARIIAGVLLAAVGAVWFAQGIGVLKGSVMTGEAFDDHVRPEKMVG